MPVIVTRHFRSGQDLALAAGPEHPVADASFSGGVFADGGSDFGTSSTVPAAMLDGITTSGGWSNRYSKAATQTLPEITASHPEDWVSVTWPRPQRFGQLNVDYTLDDHNQLPATVTRHLLERAGVGAGDRAARVLRLVVGSADDDQLPARSAPPR